jgi:hypothetical protein
MSRGLSQQQRAILGMATHVNRLSQQGTPSVKTGALFQYYYRSAVDYCGMKDIHWPLAAHLLHGIPFVTGTTRLKKSDGTTQTAGHYFDGRPPAHRSAKASTIRAISRLREAGFLHFAPNYPPYEQGYVLTEKGLAVGIDTEQPFAPHLIYRAGLITMPRCDDTYFYPLCHMLEADSIPLEAVIALYGEEPHYRDYDAHKAWKAKLLAHIPQDVRSAYGNARWAPR